MHAMLKVLRLGITALLPGLALCATPAFPEETPKGAEPDGLPTKVDLRPLFEKCGLDRREQGKRPTCSVFTMVGALEFAAAKSQPNGERLSVEFLNWAANQRRRGSSDGGFFSDLWNGFAAYGICKEQDMPYRTEFDPTQTPNSRVLAAARSRLELGLKLRWIKKWNVNTGLSDSEFRGIENTLSGGWPVCGGFRWPKQEQWKRDVLQMCPPEAVYDGHSVLLVGFRHDAEQPGGGVFIFRNTSRGGRDGFMPYDYARAYMNDAAWIEPQRIAKSTDSRQLAGQQRRND
jgi:hypothetical protein